MQRIHNLTLPRWATQDVLDNLRRVASFEVTYSILSHKRKEKARLLGGGKSYKKQLISFTLRGHKTNSIFNVTAGQGFVYALNNLKCRGSFNKAILAHKCQLEKIIFRTPSQDAKKDQKDHVGVYGKFICTFDTLLIYQVS